MISSSFNPRAPCGARPRRCARVFRGCEFQSTRPVRGATLPFQDAFCNSQCFNPRAPCGARRYPHSNLEEAFKFQSTRPVRGATCRCVRYRRLHRVSIHAPRAGRDYFHVYNAYNIISFNPRAPCGARQKQCPESRGAECFNPRAPCGARPVRRPQGSHHRAVSIHAPRAGRDRKVTNAKGDQDVSIHAPRAGRDFQGSQYHSQ